MKSWVLRICKRPSLILTFTAGVIVLAHFGLRAGILAIRYFNQDEFQHLHSAWCISKGLLPYRDYFDHHTPWLHFLLATFCPFFDVETNFHGSFRFIIFARVWSWMSCGGLLVLSILLGRFLYGGRVALVGAVLLSNTAMFWNKGIEVRPDPMAAACWMASLLLLSRGLERKGTGRGGHLASSGFFAGAAVLFTQKMLFLMPGFALAMLIDLFVSGGGENVGRRIRQAALWLIGLATPVVLTLAYFAAQGAFGEFVEYNLLLNLAWKTRFPPYALFQLLTKQNGVLVALGLLGLTHGGLRLLVTRPSKRGEVFLVLSTASAVIGSFLIPVPYRQYTLTFLAPASILAGRFLILFVDNLSLMLSKYARASGVDRVKDWAIAALLVGLSLGPLSQISFRPTNVGYLDDIRYVTETTAPTDTVMDGFTGLGVFRPHAYFYSWFHSELLQMLTGQDRRRLLLGLETGNVAPTLIFLDADLETISDEITAFFLQNYEPTDRSPVWRRREIWLDAPSDEEHTVGLGDAISETIVGPGWHAPVADEGRRFRRSRGRRSWLRLPIRNPGDILFNLNARLEIETAPVRLELAVNGEVVGSLELRPGWRAYRFEVPGRLLSSGVNSFLLTYSTTPWLVSSDRRGGNSVIAVEAIRIEPQ